MLRCRRRSSPDAAGAVATGEHSWEQSLHTGSEQGASFVRNTCRAKLCCAGRQHPRDMCAKSCFVHAGAAGEVGADTEGAAVLAAMLASSSSGARLVQAVEAIPVGPVARAVAAATVGAAARPSAAGEGPLAQTGMATSSSRRRRRRRPSSEGQ